MDVLARYLGELVHAQLEQRKPAPIPQEIDLEKIMRLSLANHMDYLILGGMLKAENLPEAYQKIYSARVFASLQRTLVQVTELKDLLAACEEKKIRNQPMKGSCMKFMYPSPEMREMSDIDILIDIERMDEIGKLLEEKGYTLSESVRQHDVYTKAPFMVVEAHRTLYDKTIDQKQYQYFSSFSKTHLREGCNYTYDYRLEDFYLYMIAHMAKHFYARGCGIRNIVDVYVFLEKYDQDLNWSYIDAELQKCGILAFAQRMRKMAEVWLKGSQGDAFYDHLFTYMLESGIYGKDENGVWCRFADAKVQNKDITPKLLKKWYYFPPLAYMTELYPWLEDRDWLLPVAWFVRAIHGVLGKKGTEKQKMFHTIQNNQIEEYREIYSQMGLHFKK